VTSALCQTQTKCGAAKASLFDYLVGRSLQRLRNGQVESLGRFPVDDKLKAGRLLDRQIGGLGASEDPIDVGRGLTEQIGIIDPVTQETALRPRITSATRSARFGAT